MLALSVWLVYIADRTLDAARPTTAAWEPERKAFYRRHVRSACAVTVGLASLIPPLAYVLLRRTAFYTGLALAIALICYLISVHLFPRRWRARWPRELAVAALFTSGTFAPIWAGNGMGDKLWAPAVVFSLLCWVNCAAIETWEWQREPSDREQAPSRFTAWVARYLFLAGLAISGLALLADRLTLAPVGFSVAISLSGIALAAVAIWRSQVSMNAFRVAIDFALCTPLLILLLPSAR